MFCKPARANQSDFLTRPEGKNDAASKKLWLGRSILAESTRQFQECSDAGCIVVRARMDLLFLAFTQHGSRFTVTQMIVMGSEHDVILEVTQRRDNRQNVTIRFLDVLHASSGT